MTTGDLVWGYPLNMSFSRLMITIVFSCVLLRGGAQDYTFASKFRAGIGYSYNKDSWNDVLFPWQYHAITLYGQVNLNKHLYVGLDYHHIYYAYEVEPDYEQAFITKLVLQLDSTPEGRFNPYFRGGMGFGNYCDCTDRLPTNDVFYPFIHGGVGMHVRLLERLYLTGSGSFNLIFHKDHPFKGFNAGIVGLSYVFG